MTVFAKKLRERADSLEISHAALAERAGLTPRAFSHYVTGQREPNLSALLRISEVLGASPNELLGVSELASVDSEHVLLLERIQAACRSISPDDLQVVDTVVQALVQELTSRRDR